VWLSNERWQECAKHIALHFGVFEHLSIVQNYGTISRQHELTLTANYHSMSSQTRHDLQRSAKSYFHPLLKNNNLLKLKAISTHKQHESHSSSSAEHAHMPSDVDQVAEPRPFAGGGATVDKPAAVECWVHWPELSRLLAVSEVTMSALHSGCGLSANGNVPSVARALMASSRFMKHARACPVDLLK